MESERMNPADIAAEVLNKERTAITRVERIKGGLTNESWLVHAGKTALVVRVSNHDSATLQIDRQSEAAILRTVADAGIGPKVLLCEPERHLLVTEYLTAGTWSSRDARAPANIQRIAALLRQLHALPIPSQAKIVDLRHVLTGYWNTLMSKGLTARAGTPEVRERARHQIAEAALDAQTCLCHNDVHHLNVLDNSERLWLVDWEYAGIGDPFFDLASVCCYHAFSEQLRRDLLVAYCGHDRPSYNERLRRMCWIFNYIRELWFAVREMK